MFLCYANFTSIKNMFLWEGRYWPRAHSRPKGPLWWDSPKGAAGDKKAPDSTQPPRPLLFHISDSTVGV